MNRKVIGAYLVKQANEKLLVLMFADGDEVAQALDEESWAGWQEEGVPIRQRGIANKEGPIE